MALSSLIATMEMVTIVISHLACHLVTISYFCLKTFFQWPIFWNQTLSNLYMHIVKDWYFHLTSWYVHTIVYKCYVRCMLIHLKHVLQEVQEVDVSVFSGSCFIWCMLKWLGVPCIKKVWHLRALLNYFVSDMLSQSFVAWWVGKLLEWMRMEP